MTFSQKVLPKGVIGNPRVSKTCETCETEITNVLCRALAAQRLQSCDRLRCCALAAHADLDTSPLPGIALVLVCFDDVASCIVNADHSIMGTAVEFRVDDCVQDFCVPQPTE